jgi:hypothetical protein
MNLNSDQIGRLQRGLELTSEAFNEISGAKLTSSSVSDSNEIISSITTARDLLKSVLEQTGQVLASERAGAGR